VRQCPTQDDPLPVFLARSYAINHPRMRHSTNSTTKFLQGTVQGAQWYTLLGGMQVSATGAAHSVTHAWWGVTYK
jgi:hypothetical protein